MLMSGKPIGRCTLPEETCPEILYHYTNGDSLACILNSNSLRFTDARFLNDSQEVRHAFTLMQSIVHRVSENYWDVWKGHGCRREHYEEMIANLLQGLSFDHLYLNAQRNAGGFPFIFSFSEESDSLDMWRAYGDFAIGFNSKRLILDKRGIKISGRKSSASGLHERMIIKKVSYRNNKGNEEFNAVGDDQLESFLAELLENTAKNNVSSDGAIYKEVRADLAKDIFAQIWFHVYLLGIKDASFVGEKEWRIVCFSDLVQNDHFIFQPGKMPRPRLDIESSGTHIANSIDLIIGGPGVSCELGNFLVDSINKKYESTIEYKKSNTPYRTM